MKRVQQWTMTSFTAKQLRLTLKLASENTYFAPSGNNPSINNNVLVLTGLRMTVTVQAVASQSVNADITIHGMVQKDMDALTVMWVNRPAATLNTVVVESNDGRGWFEVFAGTILEGQPDYRAAPQVFFRIQASVGFFQSITPAPSVSYPGDTDVAGIAEQLATAMGFKFENNGVHQSLSTPHFWGSLYGQLQQLQQAAGFDFYIQGGILAICTRNGLRTNIPPVLLNAESGLIGYPVMKRNGVTVTCLYDPAITSGGPITIKSDVNGATGDWHPYALTHHLESNTPHGAWFSSLQCWPSSLVAPA
jgi:hypothetical protein